MAHPEVSHQKASYQTALDQWAQDQKVLDQKVLDQKIRELQEWLRQAWQQLADPSMTTFSRRELRNQMKQCTADLRMHLQAASDRPPVPPATPSKGFAKPALRLLAWS
ncbi:hypothetical protein [Bradyrhizobium ivorense]|uniref:hypothetical protein n=1 Tax=Bradyrhizobium ivorense TaxID=2511166 RepID=UPI0010B12A7F|nr:hypothetical protein [Bradyrhizobium ivorense]VIO74041.1 hypothetical protein CI41S_41520 [Bradyrhizobium ivorense]